MYPPPAPESRRSKNSHKYPLIALAASGAGMILGLGLCGAGMVTQGHGSANRVAAAGLVVFCVSLLGLALSFLALIVSLIVNSTRSKY